MSCVARSSVTRRLGGRKANTFGAGEARRGCRVHVSRGECACCARVASSVGGGCSTSCAGIGRQHVATVGRRERAGSRGGASAAMVAASNSSAAPSETPTTSTQNAQSSPRDASRLRALALGYDDFGGGDMGIDVDHGEDALVAGEPNESCTGEDNILKCILKLLLLLFSCSLPLAFEPRLHPLHHSDTHPRCTVTT